MKAPRIESTQPGPSERIEALWAVLRPLTLNGDKEGERRVRAALGDYEGLARITATEETLAHFCHIANITQAMLKARRVYA